MKTLEEQIREFKIKEQNAGLDEDKLLLTIQKSRDAFYRGEEKQAVSWMEFLFWQASYVQKRWWVFQAVILAALWRFLTAASGIYLQRSIGVLSPLFVVMLLPELWKNRSAGSVEIEGAAYYSLRQIYAARMFLFAMVDILLLSVFFAVSSLTVSMTIGEMVVQFFLPFNITCCICFHTLYSRWFESEYFAVVLCMVWTAVWCLGILRKNVYEMISGRIWMGAVIISAVYLCYSACRVLKNCEGYVEAMGVQR